MTRFIFSLFIAAAAYMASLPEVMATESLVEKVTAEWANGNLVITGKMLEVPTGTKIRIDIISVSGQLLKKTFSDAVLKRSKEASPRTRVWAAALFPHASTIIEGDGSFRASIPSNENLPAKAGKYVVQINVYFNGFWQSMEVLQRAGVEWDSKGMNDSCTNPRAISKTLDFKSCNSTGGRYIETQREIIVTSPDEKRGLER